MKSIENHVQTWTNLFWLVEPDAELLELEPVDPDSELVSSISSTIWTSLTGSSRSGKLQFPSDLNLDIVTIILKDFC